MTEFLFLIYTNKINTSELKIKDQFGNSPYHSLIFSDGGAHFVDLVENKVLSKEDLNEIRNIDGETPIHILADTYPEYIVEMIENNLISIAEIAQMKNKSMDTPFHEMVANKFSDEGKKPLKL